MQAKTKKTYPDKMKLDAEPVVMAAEPVPNLPDAVAKYVALSAPEEPAPSNFLEQLKAATGVKAQEDVASKAAEHLAAKWEPEKRLTLDVDIATLVEDPRNVRHHYDADQLAKLTESIRQFGVLSPLLVREGGQGQYQIVYGHRRYRAAKAAGLQTVTVDVAQLTDVQVLELQVTENVQRADLQPLEEAEAYQRLVDEAGYTPVQIAERVGKSKAWVYARLKLLALGPEARKAFEQGKISATIAVPLARLPTHKLQADALKRLTQTATDGEPLLNSRQATAWLVKEYCQSLKAAPFDLKDPDLVPEAGACTTCPKNSASATPGLFDDLAGGAHCTDTKCFQEKCRASWALKAVKAEKGGAKVLGLEAGKKLFGEGGLLRYGTKYVEADALAQSDSKKRSWAQLVAELPEEHRPVLHVAADEKLKPHKLYVADAVTKAVAEHLELKWAKTEVERESTRVTAQDPVKQAEADAARAARTKVLEEVWQKGFKLLASGKPGVVTPVLRHVVEGRRDFQHLHDTYVDSDSSEKWVKVASIWELLALVITGELEQLHTAWSTFSDETHEVAKLLGSDLAAMSAAAVQGVKSEAAIEAKKKTKKAKKGGN